MKFFTIANRIWLLGWLLKQAEKDNELFDDDMKKIAGKP
jgi:hypothetical protein